MLQILAIGLGSVIMAVGFVLSAGKLPVVVLATFASIFSVWFYQDQAAQQIRADRGSMIGLVVGAVGPLIAFGFLGLVAKTGWRPAEDLTALSALYEGRGLSTSEISVIYNIYVGDPVLNEVKQQFFLLTAGVGLVCGTITALVLGGWSKQDSYLREKLYNWNLLYLPGEAVDLPMSAVKGFRFASFLFKSLVIGIVLALLLDALIGKNLLVAFLGVFYVALLMFIGLTTALLYIITIFLVPSKGHYMPARAKAGAMALLSFGFTWAFLAIA